MNEQLYDKYLKSKYKDLRTLESLRYFNEMYFITVYDENDNYITTFEDIESVSRAFNIPLRVLLIRIRSNSAIFINGNKYYFYLSKKEKINENYKRSK